MQTEQTWPIMAELEGQQVQWMGPEWMAHLDKEAAAYAELSGARIYVDVPPVKREVAKKRRRKAV